MGRYLLDENVSWRVEGLLRNMGHDVAAIARSPLRGAPDPDVFANAVAEDRTLITRDHHFTNPLRFSPIEMAGIIYITRSDLRGAEEADLVEKFLRLTPDETVRGHLVFLSRTGIHIR
jgi:predicted nuclease of predicted toxin-antitoxin system